ncbi:hypothetical protein LIA77_09844 [Sarocladium implicatum]|nr:hypothetical protein LIA77_09844 [Sarocladium implicatum]
MNRAACGWRPVSLGWWGRKSLSAGHSILCRRDETGAAKSTVNGTGVIGPKAEGARGREATRRLQASEPLSSYAMMSWHAADDIKAAEELDPAPWPCQSNDM